MKAFHNDPATKAKYQQRLSAHREAEHLVQGVGFETNGTTKGCAVGCTLDAYDHSRYPIELGLPIWLSHLEDRIFEGLTRGDAEQFAEDFLAAIPVGAHVEGVRAKLAIQRHERDYARLAGNSEPYAEKCRTALRGVLNWLKFEGPASAAESAESAARSAAESAWSAAWSAAESARSAAWSAAWSARSAAWSAAESARSAAESAWSAWSAAWSAWSAAESAAWSAAWSAARSAARSDHYKWEAETLLQLLKECK